MIIIIEPTYCKKAMKGFFDFFSRNLFERYSKSQSKKVMLSDFASARCALPHGQTYLECRGRWYVM